MFTRRIVLAGFIATGLASVRLSGALAVAQAGRDADPPTFAVAEADVAEIVMSGKSMELRLTPEAAARFARFTAENIDRRVRVTVDDLTYVEATVRAAISSGRVRSGPLEDAVRQRLRQQYVPK